jgi:Shikimate kinase
LVERLNNNFKSRPLLKNGNLRENLENMIKKRIQNYEKAHIIIPVDGLSIPDIVRRIINNLKYHDKN